jgi:hypothetical protein
MPILLYCAHLLLLWLLLLQVMSLDSTGSRVVGSNMKDFVPCFQLMPTLLYFAILLLLLLQVMSLDSKGSRVVGSNVKDVRPSVT